MNIQWFPGHMAKTRKLIAENLRFVDIVLEVVDARLPFSSRNPEIVRLCASKPRLTLCTKADLADPARSRLWQTYWQEEALFISVTTGEGLGAIAPKIQEMMRDKTERDAAKGIKNRPTKLMIVGVPNVGKSSLINRLSKRASAAVADRPGVTRAKQWVRLDSGLELLDTPGVLWPKFDDERVARHLAYTGAIRDEVLDVEELCHYFLEFMRDQYPDRLKERYGIEAFEHLKGYEITEAIGRRRGFLISGGEVDSERAAKMIFDEFRGGRLGRITLEKPEDIR